VCIFDRSPGATTPSTFRSKKRPDLSTEIGGALPFQLPVFQLKFLDPRRTFFHGKSFEPWHSNVQVEGNVAFHVSFE